MFGMYGLLCRGRILLFIFFPWSPFECQIPNAFHRIRNDDCLYWQEENALFARGEAGKPEEVAEMVYFLISDKASFCTGGHYLIDGGLVCR